MQRSKRTSFGTICLSIVFCFCCISKTYVSADIGANAEKAKAPQCTNLERKTIEQHLSAKTPYRAIANLNDEPPKYEGCQPKRIWAVIRHGTRNPSREIIDRAHHDLQKLKNHILANPDSQLCAEERERLRNWSFNASVKKEKYLVAEGEEELINLAERMQKRFPEILPPYYDESLYFMKFTKSQRTKKSAKSFAIGLFGRDNIKNVNFPESKKKDPILRFYKLCKRWKLDIDENPNTLENVKKFFLENEMIDALANVREKTQMKNLTIADLQLMYIVCAFETAWIKFKEPSIWCSFFTPQNLKALEFSYDLKYYWNDGYGYDLNRKIACPAIKDMFSSLEPHSKKPNATIYFTHSGTILKLLAHLGLYKDDKPLSSKDFKRDRAWKTSYIDAFASNLAFVLYECQDSPKVLTLHQERPVHLPGCPQHSDLCDLNTLRSIYSESLDQCHFEQFCHK